MRVSDFFEHEGRQYLVMEYINGFTLDTAVDAAPGPFPVAVAVDWMLQTCDVLDYLHTHEPPVIVRDLKPGNIMLDARGRIRLIDFGIARLYDSTTSTLIKGAGTPGFAPMEQCGGGKTDARSDIYALGATLYCVLTRSLPPASGDRFSAGTALNPPSVLNAAVSRELDAIVLQMMAMQTRDRQQSVQEVRTELKTVRKQLPKPESRLLNLNRTCHHCETPALPLGFACVYCGQVLPSPYGPDWPVDGASGDGAASDDADTVGSLHRCSGCGAPVAPGAAECKRCGHALIASDTDEATVVPSSPAMAAVPSAPVPRPGNALSPLRLALLACFLVVVGAGIAVLAMHYSRKVTLKMEVVPPGADVVVDDMDKGLAPLSMEVEVGRHTFRARLAGYVERTDTVDVESDDDINWVLEKSPEASSSPSP